MAWRASQDIWPGRHVMVYGNAWQAWHCLWRAWHDIWYGLGVHDLVYGITWVDMA